MRDNDRIAAVVESVPLSLRPAHFDGCAGSDPLRVGNVGEGPLWSGNVERQLMAGQRPSARDPYV